MSPLPDSGYLRLSQIIGRKARSPQQAAQNREAGKRGRTPRDATPPLIPVSAAHWYAGVRDGRYPKPIKLGRSALWRASDIRALMLDIERRQKGGDE